VQRKGKYGLSFYGWFGGQRERSDLVFAGEGIRRGTKDRYVMLQIFGDHGDFQQLGWRVRAVHEDVGLAAVAKRLENVCNGEEIAFVVDEECVAEKCVVVAA